MVSSENGFYIFSASKNELRPWKTQVDAELKTSVINRAICASDSTIVIGTLNNGLFFINPDGSLKWHLHRKNGLNNNTVLGLFSDKEGNIWVALDNGISYIRINSGLSFFEPEDVQLGLVEDILFLGNDLYMATNQGIYKYSPETKTMFLLPGFEVQSWFIRRFGNQIISGNNDGTSFIINDKNTRVPTSTGAMDIKPAILYNQEILLESTYTYLSVFRKNISGQWAYSNQVAGFYDLINQLEIDHTGNIWAGHMYRGIYRLRLNDQLNAVSEKEYFSRLSADENSTSSIRVMKLRGRIVFSDTKQFYTYDDITHKITPYEQLNNELQGLEDVNRIVPVNDISFWFVRDDEYVSVEYSQGVYHIKERIPFSILNNSPNSERGNVYVSSQGVSYLCLNGGIARYSADSESPAKILDRLRIRSAKSYNRKKGQYHRLNVKNISPISYASNNVAFEFQYTDFSKKSFTVECYLENYDNRWAATDNNLKIEYTNLPAGEYILKAKVINDIGMKLSTISIPFRVEVPWYKTAWAFFVYFITLMSAVFFSVERYTRWVIKRKNIVFAQQEKDRLAQLEKQEKLITTLKNEQLESELTYKSKELSNATMNIINQKEFLNLLKTELQNVILSGKINKTEGQKLLGLINENISNEDDWTIFQENFDLIHDNFFRKLQTKYPSLTPSDLKLCALLRLNYSSKDIAKMLNLTIRGVEAARYRLRKKLLLSEDENLVSFMIDFK